MAILAAFQPAGAEMVYHRGNNADPETLDQHKTSTIYEANILQIGRAHV
jgi:oligopeptide transport system substrate-binding protein